MRGDRSDALEGQSLLWGSIILLICGFWLILMLSNRGLTLPLFFLGGKTFAYPVVLWLFGAFVLGTFLSIGVLSLLVWSVAVPALNTAPRFDPRAKPAWESAPQSADRPRRSPSVDRDLDWDDEPEDWVDSPPESPSPTPSPTSSPASSPAPQPVASQPVTPQTPRSQTPRSEPIAAPAESAAPPPSPFSPSEEDEPDAWDDPDWQANPTPAEPRNQPQTQPQPQTGAKTEPPTSPPSGKVYETPPEQRQGGQTGSSYSYQYRPARRSPRPPQRVVDVNYRVINPGQAAPPPPKPDSWSEPQDEDW